MISQEAVGINTEDPKTTLDINGNLALRAGTVLNLNDGNNNISVGDYSYYNISGPSGDFNINQITPSTGVDGQIITLINTTPNFMTLVYDDGASINSLYTPNSSDIKLGGIYATVTLQYNSTLQRWIVLKYTDLGKSGLTINNSIGTSDTQTDLTTFSDMANMTILFTPKKSVVYVNVGISGHMNVGNGDTQGYGDFRLVNVTASNTVITGFTALASDVDNNGVATPWNARLTMVPVSVVPGQNTTLKVQWRKQGQHSNILYNLVTTFPYFSHRNISVMEQ